MKLKTTKKQVKFNLPATRKSMTLMAVCSFLSLSVTQAQTIPNGSFENWSTVTGPNSNSYERPTGWSTSDELDCNPLSSPKTTSHTDGSFAIVLETSTCVLAGGAHEGYGFISIPTTSKPLYLNGFYRSLRLGQASAKIEVTSYNGSTELGIGTMLIPTTVNTYTAFSLPITYSSTALPDHVFIFLASDDDSGPLVLGDKLWVDQLTFSNTALSVDEIDAFSAPRIYPNPASNTITINLSNVDKADLKITNTLGQEVLQTRIIAGENTIDIAELTKGVYFVKTTISGKTSVTKIMKQ